MTRLDYKQTRKAIQKKFGIRANNYLCCGSEYDTGDWHYEFKYRIGGIILICDVIVWCGDFENPVIPDKLRYEKPLAPGEEPF